MRRIANRCPVRLGISVTVYVLSNSMKSIPEGYEGKVERIKSSLLEKFSILPAIHFSLFSLP